MKKKPLMILAACALLAYQAEAENVTFGKALKENLIGFDVDPGGDKSRNMKIKIKSRGREKIVLKMEPGRFFYADKPNIQPYVVTRPSIVALEPGETEEVLLHARCGNSPATSPIGDLEFSRTAMGPEPLVKTLEEMAEYHVTDRGFFQSVVWHYTNNHSLNGVNPGNTDSVIFAKILRGICERDNKPKTNFMAKYKPDESGDDMRFTGVVEKISAKMDVVLEQEADLKVALVNAKGETIKIIGYYMQQPSGRFELPINMKADDLEKGEYSLTLTDQENKTLDQIPIQI